MSAHRLGGRCCRGPRIERGRLWRGLCLVSGLLRIGPLLGSAVVGVGGASVAAVAGQCPSGREYKQGTEQASHRPTEVRADGSECQCPCVSRRYPRRPSTRGVRASVRGDRAIAARVDSRGGHMIGAPHALLTTSNTLLRASCSLDWRLQQRQLLVPREGFQKCDEATVVQKLDEYHDKGVRELPATAQLRGPTRRGAPSERRSDAARRVLGRLGEQNVRRHPVAKRTS